MKEKFGDSQALLVGIEVDEGVVMDSPSMDAITRIHDFLEGHAEVTSIISLVNYEYTRTIDGIMEVNPFNISSTVDSRSYRSRCRKLFHTYS